MSTALERFLAERHTVTLDALVKRVNRALAGRNEVVKKARGWQARQDLGEYYRLGVLERDVDVEALARELKVMTSLERVGDERGAR